MVTGTLNRSHDAHNGRVVDVEAPGDAGQTFPVDVPSADNLANLMGRQFWFATQLDPISDSARSAFASTCSNKLTLELCQASKNGEHKTAVCCRRVGPRVAAKVFREKISGTKTDRAQLIKALGAAATTGLRLCDALPARRSTTASRVSEPNPSIALILLGRPTMRLRGIVRNQLRGRCVPSTVE